MPQSTITGSSSNPRHQSSTRNSLPGLPTYGLEKIWFVICVSQNVKRGGVWVGMKIVGESS